MKFKEEILCYKKGRFVFTLENQWVNMKLFTPIEIYFGKARYADSWIFNFTLLNFCIYICTDPKIKRNGTN